MHLLQMITFREYSLLKINDLTLHIIFYKTLSADLHQNNIVFIRIFPQNLFLCNKQTNL